MAPLCPTSPPLRTWQNVIREIKKRQKKRKQEMEEGWIVDLHGTWTEVSVVWCNLRPWGCFLFFSWFTNTHIPHSGNQTNLLIHNLIHCCMNSPSCFFGWILSKSSLLLLVSPTLPALAWNCLRVALDLMLLLTRVNIMQEKLCYFHISVLLKLAFKSGATCFLMSKNQNNLNLEIWKIEWFLSEMN